TVYDVAAIVRNLPLDWDDLIREARRASAQRVVAVGLLLASGMLDAPVPQEILLHCNQDAAVPRIAAAVRQNMFPRETLVTPLAEATLHLRMIPTLSEKLGYLWRRAIQPTHLDADFIYLPEQLSAFYYAIRPLRIACAALGF